MPQYSILEYSLGDVVRAGKALSEPIFGFSEKRTQILEMFSFSKPIFSQS